MAVMASNFLVPGFGEPLWDVVEEHLDEAEFLWEQWEQCLVAPNYTLGEVIEGPEERLLAHIDGLVVNGPLVAERLLIPTLMDEDAEAMRVCAAALALLQTPGEAGLAAVFAAVREAPLQRSALARALECCDRGELGARLASLLVDPEPGLRHVAARVLAFHGGDVAAAVPGLLGSPQARDRALGLGLVPRLPAEPRLLHEVVSALQDGDPELRDIALRSGVLIDSPQAWGGARALVGAGDPSAGVALLLLALRGEPDDHAALFAAVEDAALRGPALWALGFLGTAAAVEAALPWLEDGIHARLAGEAVCAVTGLDLEDAKQGADEPEGEALEHRAEDDLLLPDPMAVLLWWRDNRGRFDDGQRYLAGVPWTGETLWQALKDGPMRRRPAHWLALQLQSPVIRRSSLELRAPGRRQLAALAAFK